ncbi:kinase-like domain-containing protein [Syncephalis plumigaleata]|nr:kinase-like domain-containing protein [Syncephalis plumigaleata]
MSISISSTTESLSSEHLSDSLYVNAPKRWKELPYDTKRRMIGWVEIRDAKTAEYKEYMLPVDTTVEIGPSSTEPDCRINIGGPPNAYFELVAARNGITFKNNQHPSIYIEGERVDVNYVGLLPNKCHVTIPGCKTTFVVHELQPTRVNENINDEEFKEWAEENCIMTETRLGAGGQGAVYLGVDRRTKEYVAIKSFRGGDDQDTAAREASILKELRGYPYFIQMVGKCITSRNTYIVLQHAWGDLDRYIDLHGTVSEECAKTIFKQLLEGMQIMHDNDLVHRDIKPGNILLLEFSQAPTAVYADFGLTQQLISPVELLTDCVGTYAYMAPEVLKTHPRWDDIKLNLKNSSSEIAQPLNSTVFANDGYGKPSDMWSLGITLFQMLFGAFPFEWGDAPHDKLANILSMDVSTLNQHGRVTNECMELISNLLKVDADKRYTAEDALECAWFTAEGVSSPTASAVEESSLSTEITVELTPPSTESVVEAIPPAPPQQPPKRKWRLPYPPTRTYYSRKAKRGPINYKC